ncbi:MULTISPECIES: hypothetical protein [unclassified Microbacterium]|uniref:VG15 protein n=1 Tax=unclassified Microbacterium TaxID=2609290 RepID=UPI000EA902F3|nr:MULTISPECIES: hypothetical protein [unclassified Microbacterium]MBT2485805.1 hypothetical protein [Microbacterium sp. ISL-108]RKN68567.1 hypothetical protein D7252_13900 [Microbacterium sp. CGR2]
MTDDFDESWSRIAAGVFDATAAGQYAAAVSGVAYVGTVLAETGVEAPAVARVSPIRFAGGSTDGGELDSLLSGSVVKAKQAVAEGLAPALALTAARGWLQSVVMDTVRDADRQAVGAGITVRPKVQGWVRMLNPPSCKFCIVLGGQFYRWNQGFQSHPHCDCRHIPSQESDASDFTINPRAYFRTLDDKTQDRLFGKKDAQAIRDGADINQVVNIRGRGFSGKQLRREPDLMTVDHIYDQATSREEAIELLRMNGFISRYQ